ncbi:HNH endonuclease [Sansalvadorimonas sp. 2012CJ34-2]|uniref:HNH endonuclease n=1 Tax=Parendozoicomonas callyspongiae TaxID=2942213 RepID=A0ABT0PJ77_9GAMM|nr:HNH endonuclease [Sansalvadorimonas sp. 2012CJ34-2]MCL6271434.1 HNH endonuclease [Sansalvadorimonas sp. 2012CJ34-2]
MAKAQLQRLLWLQGNTCFYCGRKLHLKEASIDHVLPRSEGGTDVVANKVVCCRTINQTFANMPIKEKMRCVIQWRGDVPCPMVEMEKIASVSVIEEFEKEG